MWLQTLTTFLAGGGSWRERRWLSLPSPSASPRQALQQFQGSLPCGSVRAMGRSRVDTLYVHPKKEGG